MNILNIFNNLVTLSTPHNPTHTLPKQPQCSYKYNVYQYVVPTLQGNPPMSAASEESTAGFSPEAPQTGKKGDRAAETGRQKRAAETGGKNGAAETGRQKRGGRKQMPENGLKAPAAGGWHRKKPDKNTAKPNTDRKSPKPNTKIRKLAGKARKLAEEPDAEETGIPKAKRIGQGQNKKRKLGIKTDRPSSTVSSPT